MTLGASREFLAEGRIDQQRLCAIEAHALAYARPHTWSSD